MSSFFLVPRLCLGTEAEKLRFVQEAELQQIRTPKPELGSQKTIFMVWV
jgi:hypothetical protein